MASNTLLAGELARRNKDTDSRTEAIDYNPSMQNGGEANQHENNNNGNGSDWKMALYQQPPQQTPNACVESLDHQKSNYRSPSFSMALQDLIGIDLVNSSQAMVDDSGKLGTHFSNPSSIVTSLGSSREVSPDKTGSSMLFAKPPLSTGVSSWFPSAAQLRPAAISMAHLPVFAAWTDT